MALTNLKWTKWVLNETLQNHLNDSGTVFLNFTSNDKDYTAMYFEYNFSLHYFTDVYNDEGDFGVYVGEDDGGNNEWSNQAYRTITITGGEDIENKEVIAWLKQNATLMEDVDLTGTKWKFNEKVNMGSGSYFVDFLSNDGKFIEIIREGPDLSFHNVNDEYIWVHGNYSDDDFMWTSQRYRTIVIVGGEDVRNPDLIAFLQENATQVEINLANTKWTFNENIDLNYDEGVGYNILFTSNNNNYYCFFRGDGDVIDYEGTDDYVGAYSTGYGWTEQVYRTIEITGGEDITNTELIAFLYTNASLLPQNFKETKTALKIYEDLSQNEYIGLKKDNDTFYQVNGIGIYKGDKLIATNINAVKLDSDISNLKDDVLNLRNDKQDKISVIINSDDSIDLIIN